MAAVHSTFSSYGEHTYDIYLGKPETFDQRDSYIDLRFPYWDQTSGGSWQHVGDGNDAAATMMQRVAKDLFRSYLYWMGDDLLHRMPFLNVSGDQLEERKERWRSNARSYHAALRGTDNKDRRYFGSLVDGDTHDDQALVDEVLALIDQGPPGG